MLNTNAPDGCMISGNSDGMGKFLEALQGGGVLKP